MSQLAISKGFNVHCTFLDSYSNDFNMLLIQAVPNIYQIYIDTYLVPKANTGCFTNKFYQLSRKKDLITQLYKDGYYPLATGLICPNCYNLLKEYLLVDPNIFGDRFSGFKHNGVIFCRQWRDIE